MRCTIYSILPKDHETVIQVNLSEEIYTHMHTYTITKSNAVL